MSEETNAETVAAKIVRNNIIALLRDMGLEDLQVVESIIHEIKTPLRKRDPLENSVDEPSLPRGAERRRFKRIEMALPLLIKPLKTPDKPIRVNTCDISGGGARFNITEPVGLEMGDKVVLHMMLPDGQNALMVQSVVVRTVHREQDNSADISIEFFYISNQDRQRIERFTGRMI